jgi:hypothetical protein
MPRRRRRRRRRRRMRRRKMTIEGETNIPAFSNLD